MMVNLKIYAKFICSEINLEMYNRKNMMFHKIYLNNTNYFKGNCNLNIVIMLIYQFFRKLYFFKINCGRICKKLLNLKDQIL